MMNYNIIEAAIEKYGTPLYIFDRERFINNFKDLQEQFSKQYSNFNIAYSFKTNYTPDICKTILELGGLAEVVSEYEYNMAKKIGFSPDRIIVNGPGKIDGIEAMLEEHALVIFDNFQEIGKAIRFSKTHPNMKFRVGLRLNFEIGSGKNSRFGFDVLREDVGKALNILNENKQFSLDAISFHLSGARTLEAWEKRADKILYYVNKFDLLAKLKFIDIGSGMYGNLSEDLAKQFNQPIPSFEDYAKVVGSIFYKELGTLNHAPTLLVEPGTTLVADTINYYTKVVATKIIRNRNIAITDGSYQQLGELSLNKKLPTSIFLRSEEDYEFDFPRLSNPIEICGYTCLENDIMYSEFEEELQIGDILCFENVGSYSNVLKPAFIKQSCAMVSIYHDKIKLIKEEESFDDFFKTYIFG